MAKRHPALPLGTLVSPVEPLTAFYSGYAGNAVCSMVPDDIGVVASDCGRGEVCVDFWKPGGPHYGEVNPWRTSAPAAAYRVVSAPSKTGIITPLLPRPWTGGVCHHAHMGALVHGMSPVVSLSAGTSWPQQGLPWVVLATWEELAPDNNQDSVVPILLEARAAMVMHLIAQGWRAQDWDDLPWPLRPELEHANEPLAVQHHRRTWHLRDPRAWWPPHP